MGILAPRTVGTTRKQICVQGPSSTSAQLPSPIPEKAVDKTVTKPLKAVSSGVKKSPKASSQPKRTAPNIFGKPRKARKGSKAAKAAEILRNGNFFPATQLASSTPKPVRIITSTPAPQPNLTPELLGAKVLANQKRQQNIDNCLRPVKCLDLPAKKVVPPGTITLADRCAESLKAIPLFEFRTKTDITKRTMTSLATACGFDKLDDPALAHSRVQEFLFETVDRCVLNSKVYLRNTAPDSERLFYIQIYNELRQRYSNDNSIDMSKIGAVALHELMDALVMARYSFKLSNDDSDETRLTFITDMWDEVWGEKMRM